METNEQGVTHVPPGGGKKLWVTDELMTFKASGEDTGGAYSLTDSMVPPRGGPPPHIHHREDEAFWVLEGVLEVLVGETGSMRLPVLLSTSLEASSTPTRTSASGPPDF